MYTKEVKMRWNGNDDIDTIDIICMVSIGVSIAIAFALAVVELAWLI